jgi:hypothetical protein
MAKTKAQLITEIASLKTTYAQEKREYEEAMKQQGDSQSSAVGLTDPDETTGREIQRLEAELAKLKGGRRKTRRHRRKSRKSRKTRRHR